MYISNYYFFRYHLSIVAADHFLFQKAASSCQGDSGDVVRMCCHLVCRLYTGFMRMFTV